MGTLIYTHYLIDKVNKINQIAGMSIKEN